MSDNENTAADPPARPSTPNLVERMMRDDMNIAFIEHRDAPFQWELQIKFTLEDSTTFDARVDDFLRFVTEAYEAQNDAESIPELIYRNYPYMYFMFGYGDEGRANGEKYKETMFQRFQQLGLLIVETAATAANFDNSSN